MTQLLTPQYAAGESNCADSIHQYMQEIRRYPRLTPEQERTLAMGCAAGEEKAIKAMVSSNLMLVVSVAREYAGRGVPMLDLIQEGSIGLIAAAKKFDYTRNLRFSTYATKWIHQGIARCVMEHQGLMRVPHYTSERISRVLRIRQSLMQQNAEEPTVEQLAQACQMSEDNVEKLLQLCPQVYSLDTPVGEDGTEQMLLEDLQAPRPEEELVRQELKRTLDEMLCLLTQRQQQVLRLRYGLTGEEPCSMEQAGKQLGISKERVRQIEHEAMDKLKKMGADFGLEDFLSE